MSEKVVKTILIELIDEGGNAGTIRVTERVVGHPDPMTASRSMAFGSNESRYNLIRAAVLKEM